MKLISPIYKDGPKRINRLTKKQRRRLGFTNKPRKSLPSGLANAERFREISAAYARGEFSIPAVTSGRVPKKAGVLKRSDVKPSSETVRDVETVARAPLARPGIAVTATPSDSDKIRIGLLPAR